MTNRKLTMVVNELNNILGENMARIQTITKNNGVTKTGIVIGVTGACPVFYADDYDGRKSAKNIAEEILKTYETIPKENMEVDLNSMLSKENIIENVMPRLISEKMNAELLKSVPHRTVADNLCFIYTMEAMSNGTVKITNDYMSNLGITEEDLYKAAIVNAMKREPVEKNLVQMMAEIMGKAVEELDVPKEENQIVVTNKEGLFGACYIFVPEFLEHIHKTYGNFIMLPSSVHEVIILPREKVDENEMDQYYFMVASVNEDTVLEQERLANRAYFYGGEWH